MELAYVRDLDRKWHIDDPVGVYRRICGLYLPGSETQASLFAKKEG
jgi:hypothetical protein